MKPKGTFQLRLIVPVLVLALVGTQFSYAQQAAVSSPPPAEAQDIPPMPPLATDKGTAPQSGATQSDPLPDSPGAVQSAQLAPPAQPSQAMPKEAPPQRPQEPLGTAAAETVPTLGIAASQPAGAALAPGKQRRVRTILISLGAALGVGAAVGATMALSQASPGRPPGATH
jgi:hypothetical protein